MPHLYHGSRGFAAEFGKRGGGCNNDGGADAVDAAGQVGGGARDGVEGEGCAGGERSVGLYTREKVGESIGRDEDVLGSELFGFREGCDGRGNTSDYIFVGELDNFNLPHIPHISGAEYNYRRCLQVNLATVCHSGDFDDFVVHSGLYLGAWG